MTKGTTAYIEMKTISQLHSWEREITRATEKNKETLEKEKQIRGNME